MASMDDDEKMSRRQQYEEKIKNIEEKINRAQMAEDTKFKIMKDQISKLSEGISSEQLLRESIDERKAKELKLCENNISIELNIERQNRRETDAKIQKMLDERLYSLKLDLAKEKKMTEDAEERYSRAYGE